MLDGPCPSQSEVIRAWLELQPEPRTCPEIAAAIGQPGETRVYQNVHRMFRDGILAREGQCRSYVFRLAREPRTQSRMPRDEQLRRNADAERARRRRKHADGARTRKQYLAQMAAQHQAWLDRKDAEKAARKAARQSERNERKSERKARPKRPKAPPKPRVVRLRPSPPPKPALAPVRVESVQDYLRRGGKITRLEPFAVSRPLRINQERKAA
jgi:hypothetical protein